MTFCLKSWVKTPYQRGQLLKERIFSPCFSTILKGDYFGDFLFEKLGEDSLSKGSTLKGKNFLPMFFYHFEGR